MGYPNESTEYDIIKMHVPSISKDKTKMMEWLQLVAKMRDNLDLPYHPTIRESITLARLYFDGGVNINGALKLALVDVYAQWGRTVQIQVAQYIESKLAGVKIVV
jgi:hypothetical protein